MAVDREEFSLLNLSDTGSESVPDLDLVQNTRKLNKRKVKYKKRSRSMGLGRGKDGIINTGSSRSCESGFSGCRIVGVVFLLSCLGSLLFLTFTLSGKVRVLEERIAKVDATTKTVPTSIIEIKSKLENVQSNATVVYSRLKELEERLTSLESSVTKLSSKQQPQDVHQTILDLGAKLSEAKSHIDSLKKITVSNSQALNLLNTTIASSQGTSVQKEEEEKKGGEDRTGAIDSLLAEVEDVKAELSRERESVSQLNATVSRVAHNATARLDWFNADSTQLQGRVSQLEDDNRNISSRLQSLDVTLNKAVSQLKLNLSEVAKLVHNNNDSPQSSFHPTKSKPVKPIIDPSSSLIKSPPGLSKPSSLNTDSPHAPDDNAQSLQETSQQSRQGPRDKKSV